MKAIEMLSKIKELVGVEASEEVKLAQATLDNGTIIESESFTEGSEVFIVTEDEKVALPVGSYKLEDGETLVIQEEGIIKSVGKEEETEAEEVEVEAEEKKEMAYATKEELAELKSMIEEVKSMIEKKQEEKEEMEKQDLSEVEKVKHNPEQEVNKQELNLFAQNRAETSFDRVLRTITN